MHKQGRTRDLRSLFYRSRNGNRKLSTCIHLLLIGVSLCFSKLLILPSCLLNLNCYGWAHDFIMSSSTACLMWDHSQASCFGTSQWQSLLKFHHNNAFFTAVSHLWRPITVFVLLARSSHSPQETLRHDRLLLTSDHCLHKHTPANIQVHSWRTGNTSAFLKPVVQSWCERSSVIRRCDFSYLFSGFVWFSGNVSENGYMSLWQIGDLSTVYHVTCQKCVQK